MKKNNLGASLVEVALLITLIAVIAIPAVRNYGMRVRCLKCYNAHRFDQSFPPDAAFKNWFIADCYAGNPYAYSQGC